MREMTDEQRIRRKVREINDHVFAGKLAYWNQSPQKKYRVFRARYSKGRFQIMPLAPQKWLDAGINDVFELYRG